MIGCRKCGKNSGVLWIAIIWWKQSSTWRTCNMFSMIHLSRGKYIISCPTCSRWTRLYVLHRLVYITYIIIDLTYGCSLLDILRLPSQYEVNDPDVATNPCSTTCYFFCCHQGYRVRGCDGSVASLLPYRNATKIFLPIFDFDKIFHTLKY
jgi:hypothetical protein